MTRIATAVLLAASLRPGGSAPPYRQPQVAAGHGRVAMAFGAGSSIYFATSTDGGRSFQAPVKVAEVGALALGRHRGPRLAILRDAMAIAAIVGEKQVGDLVTWRSTDGGKSWGRTGTVNDIAGAAREGLHAIVAAPDGGLVAAWLDLRGKGTQLMGARSSDGGRTWTKNALVYASPDGTICQCCHPTLAVADDGRVWAMWRNALDGARDLYIASSADGVRFEAARKLGEGTWRLSACPMDGGGLAASGGEVTSAWRREGEFFCRSGSGGDARRDGEGCGSGAHGSGSLHGVDVEGGRDRSEAARRRRGGDARGRRCVRQPGGPAPMARCWRRGRAAGRSGARASSEAQTFIGASSACGVKETNFHLRPILRTPHRTTSRRRLTCPVS